MTDSLNLPAHIQSKLDGLKAEENELKLLTDNFEKESMPFWYLHLIQNNAVIGAVFTMDKETDLSGLGVNMTWMKPSDTVEESQEFYPGIAVTKMGYVPVGICRSGSGDPYFLKMSPSYQKATLVRIPHDLVEEDDSYLEENIEYVSHSLVEFFDLCSIVEKRKTPKDSHNDRLEYKQSKIQLGNQLKDYLADND
ncbi:MAG: hypothetical protein HRT35_00215 [Algicola sp.]|nr:hypothetical protein [Algicola sp.]